MVEPQPSKLKTRVRSPSPALMGLSHPFPLLRVKKWLKAREFFARGWYTQAWGWYTQVEKRNGGVYKCTMSKIPKVKKGIEHSLSKTVQDMKKGPDKGLIHLGAFWTAFRKDQPYLAKLIIREMKQFKSQKLMSAFAHGVWMTYAALQSQEEADEMNDDWGIK